MAAEHRFQATDGQRLCANNCGFFGSPSTLDLCSKCYRDLLLRKQQPSSATLTEVVKARGNPFPFASASSSSSSASDSTGPSEPAHQNRCSVCRKRVGLTGFRCRCRSTFCGSHRYPEQHDCGFDYKAVGREAIALANPVVKAPKMHKI